MSKVEQIVDHLLETRKWSREADAAAAADSNPPRDRFQARDRGVNYYVNSDGSRVSWKPGPPAGSQKIERAAGRNSVAMSRNRNSRHQRQGFPDFRYSVKDRDWPT